MTAQEVGQLIRQALPDARIEVRTEDNVHFAALIVSASFAGKRPIARHQVVYKALGELMGGEIHALSIDALTPDEATARGVQRPGQG